MDLKLIFLIVSIAIVVYKAEVNISDGKHSALATGNFNITKAVLYNFVTLPHMVDRWVDWIPLFVAADQKNLGIGKAFQIFSGNDAILFRVTDFIEGDYIAMESDLLLCPRIELRFFELKPIISNTFTDGEDCNWHSTNSQLQIRFTFRRTSAIFQYTLGAVMRNLFEKHLRRSLHNLETIMMRPEPRQIKMFP